MSDKEKIRAEIERRYRENKADGYSDVCEELWDILSFIDSMQEEPVSDDLKKVAELYTLDDSIKPWRNLTKEAFKAGAQWQKGQMMANATDAMIGLPYENKDGGYTHLIDVSRPLPVGNNKIAIIFKED